MDKQTIFLKREKCQTKYAHNGACAFCGQAIPKDRQYCNVDCEEDGRKIGGDCQTCGVLTQEGQTYCSKSCEEEGHDLNLLSGWFSNEFDNKGMLVFWNGDDNLQIDLYKTMHERTARDNPETMIIRSMIFVYSKSGEREDRKFRI